MPKTLTKEDRINLEQMKQQAVGEAVTYEHLSGEFASLAGNAFVRGDERMAEEFRRWSRTFTVRSQNARKEQKKALDELGEDSSFLRV